MVGAVYPQSQSISPAFAGGRFSFRNFENEAIQNEVLNRSLIDIIGYEPWVIGFSRNGTERLEKLMDGVAWFTIGLGLPLLLQRPLSKFYERALKNKFNLSSQTKGLLNTSFTKLEKSHWQGDATQSARLAKKLGLANANKLGGLVKWVVGAKLAIVLVDLFFMAAKGEIYFWGRNLLTEKRTHKKGFSGEMGMATSTQLENNAKEYNESKTLKQRLSMVFSGVAVAGLPLVLLGLLRSKATVGKGVVGKTKKLLKSFDYHNTIYMSKWVMFWSNLFSWNLVGYLAARSKNEKREQVVKSVISDVMVFMGDAVFAGLAGKWLQKKYKGKLAGVKLFNRGWLGVPIERKLGDIKTEANKVKMTKPAKAGLIQMVDKLARWQFRIGILSTSLILGIATTLANNVYTKKKLLDQQADMAKHYGGLFKQPLSSVRRA